jgi:hypothetical protein
MQIPPTTFHLFLDPPPSTPRVYDTPPPVVRRRPFRVLAATLRRRPPARECLSTLPTDLPSQAVGRG